MTGTKTGRGCGCFVMRGCGWGDFVTRTVISLVVTPAKAGVQGLNNKAALWAAFHCVAFGDSYLWVADPRQVAFLCLSKEKSPKETTPRSARHLLRTRGAPIHGAPVRQRGSPPDFHDTSASPTGRSPTRRVQTTCLGLKHGLA